MYGFKFFFNHTKIGIKQDGGLLSKKQKKSTGKKQTNKMADYFIKIHETCHGNDGTTWNV